MPCNSDYLDPNSAEIEISRVLYFIAEVNGKTREASWLRGFHPAVYNSTMPKKERDKFVAELCSLLTKLGEEKIRKLSLELQIWWRDHKAADRAREAYEQKAARTKALKESALSKLTPEERKALLGE